MSQIQEKHGSCLCGAVKLSVRVDNNSVGACHCGMCRKWAGGPTLMVHSKDPVQITAGQPKLYSSSDWAERAFCEQCGTHLYYRLKSGHFHSVSVGVLEGDDWDFNLQVYVDSRPGYYCFANQTEEMTGAEVEAKFS